MPRITKKNNKEAENSKDRKPYYKWDNDAVIIGGKTSLDCVIEWLLTSNNYARGKSAGKTKDMLTTEVIDIMKANGIQNRTSKDIKSKIYEMQKGFNLAENYRQRTREGTLDKPDGEIILEAKILDKFKYYYILENVMGDRVANRPLYTSETIQNMSDDEDYDIMSINDEIEYYNIRNETEIDSAFHKTSIEIQESINNNSINTFSVATPAKSNLSSEKRCHSISIENSQRKKSQKMDFNDVILIQIEADSKSKAELNKIIAEKITNDNDITLKRFETEKKVHKQNIKKEMFIEFVKSGMNVKDAKETIETFFM